MLTISKISVSTDRRRFEGPDRFIRFGVNVRFFNIEGPLQPQRARIRQQRLHTDHQRTETEANGTFPLLDTAIDGCFRLYRKYHHRSQPVPVEEVLSGDPSGRLSAQGFPTGIRPPHFGTRASGHQIYARKLKVIVT